MKRIAVVALLATLLACKSKSEPEPEPKAGPKPVTAIDAAVAVAAVVTERWGGAILIPQQQPLEFEVTFTVAEPVTATISIPAQKLVATALTNVVYDAKELTFTLENSADPATHARFRLERGDDGQTARGTLDQHGGTMQVRMKRFAEGEHVGAGGRAQDPAPPLPYDQREARYQSKDGTALAGTLTLPRGAGKHPAVLLITGSGAQDRNAEMFGHRLFLVLADHLTRAGIAVLRVDDRGVAGSAGDTMAASIDDKVDDALAGVAWLAAQPEIDVARIGLAGHSEGGAIAPVVAVRATSPAIAFVALLAAPGVTGAELAIAQNELEMRVAGTSEQILAVRMAGLRKVVELQVAGGDAAALRAAVTEMMDAMAAVVPATERPAYEGAQRQLTIDTSVAALDSAAQRSFSLLDPTVALAQVRVPVLALNGALDLQVPAADNLAKIRGALERAGNADVTIEELPGLNHLFQPAKKGLTSEYALIDTTFDPAALAKIAAWMRARAKL